MVSEARRYEVLAVLGQGGFGTVYHARFLGEGGFSKEVALKVLNPEMESVAEIASRLRDEARVLGLVRHRAIVGVDRLTMLDGRWTVVMEYIEGHDLGRLLALGPLPPGVALEITAEIAGALHAAYNRNGPNGQPLRLLHRDLKPSNVRVTPFGEVKVLDFGIARAEFVEREAKTRSLAFGTPEYMSPERLDASGDTAAGDIYSLGSVLYELVAGVQLGRTSANPEKHARRLGVAMAGLREVDTPAPLCTLIQAMLSFDEADRPSAGEVERRAAAMARQLADVPLRAWVDGLVEVSAPPVPDAGAATGSILVEKPSATSDVDGTVWQRAPVSQEVPARVHRTPVKLEPAVTEAVVPSEPGRVEVGPLLANKPARQTPAPAILRSQTAPRSRVTLALVTVILLVGGLVAWMLGAKPFSGPAEAPTESTGTTASMEVSPPDTPVQLQQEMGPSTTAEAVPATAQALQGAQGAPPPSPPPTARARQTTPRATVRLTGDAARASLRSSNTRYALPTTVPYGTYTIMAAFDESPEAAMGTLSVDGPQPITVNCDSQFGKCAVNKDAL